MENLPATKDQYNHWPATLQQVQLARVGEYFKDIANEDIAALCKLIANERGLKIEETERIVSWLKNHFPHLRPKQFNLAFELYDARTLNEKYLKFKAFKYFTKEFIGIVLDGFKEYNQQKIKEITLLEQKEKAKTEGEAMTSDQRAASVFKILKANGVDIKMHTEELKKKDRAKEKARLDDLNAYQKLMEKKEGDGT